MRREEISRALSMLDEKYVLEALELEVIHGDGLAVSESNFNLSFDGYGTAAHLRPTAERYFFSVSGKK